jgi:hypothetical protein
MQTTACGLGLKCRKKQQTSLVRQGWRVEDEVQEDFRTALMGGKPGSQFDVQHQTFCVKE